MEKWEIRPLLDGIIAKNSLTLLQVLEGEIKGLYAVFGKHHTMEQLVIAADVNFIAKRLNEAIKMDSKYASLRQGEIPYMFRQGAQGALGEKYKGGISLAMVYAWLNDYMSSAERRGALSEWVAQHSADLPDANGLHQGKKMTEEDMWKWVESSYENYCRQLALKAQKVVPIMLQSSKVPWAGMDVSGLQTKFLKERGYMSSHEKFHEFLDRAIENEGIFVKI